MNFGHFNAPCIGLQRAKSGIGNKRSKVAMTHGHTMLNVCESLSGCNYNL